MSLILSVIGVKMEVCRYAGMRRVCSSIVVYAVVLKNYWVFAWKDALLLNVLGYPAYCKDVVDPCLNFSLLCTSSLQSSPLLY